MCRINRCFNPKWTFRLISNIDACDAPIFFASPYLKKKTLHFPLESLFNLSLGQLAQCKCIIPFDWCLQLLHRTNSWQITKYFRDAAAKSPQNIMRLCSKHYEIVFWLFVQHSIVCIPFALLRRRNFIWKCVFIQFSSSPSTGHVWHAVANSTKTCFFSIFQVAAMLTIQVYFDWIGLGINAVVNNNCNIFLKSDLFGLK